MRNGPLRHRVEIQKLDDGTAVQTNDFGEPQQQWSTLVWRYAEIQPLSGRDVFESAQVRSDVSHRIRIRYFAMPSPARVKWGQRLFNVEWAANPNERARGTLMEVYCKELV